MSAHIGQVEIAIADVLNTCGVAERVVEGKRQRRVIAFPCEDCGDAWLWQENPNETETGGARYFLHGRWRCGPCNYAYLKAAIDAQK